MKTVYISKINVVKGDYQVILSDGSMLSGITHVTINSSPKEMILRAYPLLPNEEIQNESTN